MKRNLVNGVFSIRLIIFSLFILFGISLFFYPRFNEKTFGSEDNSPRNLMIEISENQPKDYSKFTHGKHKQSCNSCHKFPSSNWKKVRKEPFPDITDYPQHQSCLSCHRQQFFGSPKPTICSICHTNPSPRNSLRHPFSNPREVFDQSPKGKTAVSDFAISFPHDKHIEIVSRNEKSKNDANALFVKVGMKRASEESCGVCHQTYQPQGDSDDEYLTKPPGDLGDKFWLKKGTFKTSPIGHTNCFTCHNTETEILPAPSNCAACHKSKETIKLTDFDAKISAPMKIDDKIMLMSWRNRDASATFRHEFSSHADLECASCHNVAEMNTLVAATKKVSINSCAMCHITATTDDGGILNYEIDQRKKDAKFQCVKCHIAFGNNAIPESHFKAIEAQK